ncbi:hypothetical protein RKD44_003301 [Streptomyces collinus]
MRIGGRVSGLRVSVWKRYGHDRLYVNQPDGTKVAWLDRRTGSLELLVEEQRDAVLDALAPYLATSSLPVVHKALRSEDDLVGNRPGDALQRKVDELAPGFWRWVLARMSGRRLEVDSWRTGLAGERRVGVELERLAWRGWRVLHSIPLAGDVDIDHVLIGPGGAFCVNTKCHRGARVCVCVCVGGLGSDRRPVVPLRAEESSRGASGIERADACVWLSRRGSAGACLRCGGRAAGRAVASRRACPSGARHRDVQAPQGWLGTGQGRVGVHGGT